MYKTQIDRIILGYKTSNPKSVEEYFALVLTNSQYIFQTPQFNNSLDVVYDKERKLLLVEYSLPTLEDTPNIKNFKFIKSRQQYERTLLTNKELNSMYERLIYNITLRSLMEIFHYDTSNVISAINFNGRVKNLNRATGITDNNCILSVFVKKDIFTTLNLLCVDAKLCFRHLKGVASTKISELSPVIPIMEINKEDKRFINSHNVEINSYTNLATMDWGEFEHLIRELFEAEFNKNGGEVKVTQSSRDGGVDAIAFDPDPIRGGKIIIQAKRYTNTVGVSAVRDLYGTVLNEGANKGILVTTSNYGSDSYEFAKDKPLTLLNGGHILYLLEKQGRKARIDIEEAKMINKL